MQSGVLTDIFYQNLAGTFKGDSIAADRMYMAVGSGLAAWDRTLPELQRSIARLENEVARRQIRRRDVQFLDEGDQPTNTPTAKVRISTEFLANEGEGTLREIGLFGGKATNAANSGLLISYFVFPRLEKLADARLQRSITVDLTPHASGPGHVVTRYLGNVRTEETHDLDNLTGACQIEEIPLDKRIYFGSPDQATAYGYDFCAFCFGRERSER